MLAENRAKYGRELRSVVVETLQELMKEDERVLALEADLGGASGFSKLPQDKLVNVGIAEANMIGVASGLSLTGYVPFAHTFAPFATRRAFDQLYLSGGYAHTHINIFGSDGGFAVGANGGTHTAFEDMALMRMIPNAVICDVADEVQMKFVVRAMTERYGVNYFRGNRKAVRNVYAPNTTFELGRGIVLKEGVDLALIACGQLVSEALDVAEELEQLGQSVSVIDMFTIKPIDKELILSTAKNVKKIVTIENHSIYGGLGSAVAEILAEVASSVKLKRIGIDEKFGQVGSPEYLQRVYGLDKEGIFQTAKGEI